MTPTATATPSTAPERARTSSTMGHGAVFLDRDGTVIVDQHYLKDAKLVALTPHAAKAIFRLNAARVPVIVVTNQSGIARGLLTEHDYRAVRLRIDQLLAEHGARIDDHYHCPHHPDFTGPCDCRKPGIALFERAIVEHQIDAAASTFIGDKFRDVAPALRYRARGILVPSADTGPEDVERTLTAGLEIAASLAEASMLILPGPHSEER